MLKRCEKCYKAFWGTWEKWTVSHVSHHIKQTLTFKAKTRCPIWCWQMEPNGRVLRWAALPRYKVLQNQIPLSRHLIRTFHSTRIALKVFSFFDYIVLLSGMSSYKEQGQAKKKNFLYHKFHEENGYILIYRIQVWVSIIVLITENTSMEYVIPKNDPNVVSG